MVAKMVRRSTKEVEDPTTGLRPNELSRLREALDAERVRVARALVEHLSAVTARGDDLADEIDQAAHAQDQAYHARLADKEQKLLAEIDRALQRMAEGTYGLCEGSGEPIGYPRLAARPWTRFSIEFKELIEQERRMQGAG